MNAFCDSISSLILHVMRLVVGIRIPYLPVNGLSRLEIMDVETTAKLCRFFTFKLRCIVLKEGKKHREGYPEEFSSLYSHLAL